MTNFHFINVTADRSRQLAIAGAVWLGLAAVGILLFVFNPAQVGLFPKCPFRSLTGLQCPGCGSTRAFHQLLHLHPIAAFKLNPLMMLTLPFIVYGFLGYTKSRSEEHTSELQSHLNLVCRLLLEKKKCT